MWYSVMKAIFSGIPVEVTFTNKTSVTVTHGKGYYPQVQVLDSNRDVMDVEVNHNSAKTAFTITLAVADSGTIIYN